VAQVSQHETERWRGRELWWCENCDEPTTIDPCQFCEERPARIDVGALADRAYANGFADGVTQESEQNQARRDEDLIRRAISDPGQFVEREVWDDGYPGTTYESIESWGARAVVAALTNHPSISEGGNG
jgi:hypothetical protein